VSDAIPDATASQKKNPFDWCFQWGRVPLNHPLMTKYWNIFFYGFCIGEIGIGLIVRRDKKEAVENGSNVTL
jgi:hypothetical protein